MTTTFLLRHFTFHEVAEVVEVVLPHCIAVLCAEYSQTATCRYIPALGIWITGNMNGVFDTKKAEWNIEMSSSLCKVIGYESLLQSDAYEIDQFDKHRKVILCGHVPTDFGPYLSYKVFCEELAECQFLLRDMTSNKHDLFTKLRRKFPTCARCILRSICQTYIKRRIQTSVCIVEIGDDMWGHAYFIDNFASISFVIMQIVGKCSQ